MGRVGGLDASDAPARNGPGPAELLRAAGTPGGPTEQACLAALREASGTLAEIEALRAVAEAAPLGRVAPSVLCAAALAHRTRGETARALRLLEHASSLDALMLRAEMLREDGQGPLALSVIERVLARDIQYPGALERWSRWRPEAPSRQGHEAPLGDVTMALPAQSASPFRILREVARGGAGTIYEACDDALGRRVALKVYHRGQEGPDQIRREARTCVALAGPGVVRLYEADFDQGWIALEWLALGSARELLESRRLDVLADVARWAEPLAGALARVHAAGLVHADVKPGNVLFREPGVPLLNDFGISAPAGRGSLGGSRGYLSPERLAGEPLAPDDDVYGFGRLLEDVLQVVPDAPSAGALRDLSDQCMRPRAHRPPDGAAVRAILAGSSLLLAGG